MTLHDHNQATRVDFSDKFLGALLGTAIGDAFGMPVEGYSRSTIQQTHGWISSYLARIDSNGDEIEAAGEITDDTEMMLCHVESLVSTGGLVDPENTGMRFLRLLNSDSRRFMGRTTREALERADETGDFQSGLGGEHRAGNGVAMRIAPIGLVHSVGRFNHEVFVREVMRAGLITHSNPEAINGAVALAYGVRLQVTGEVPPDVLGDEICSFIDEDQVSRSIRQAAHLAARKGLQRDDYAAHLEHLSAIGTSEYVAESVAAAIYCAIVARDDIRRGIELAANAGGDTDSVAAMAGALIGARTGASAFPLDLVEGLAGRAYILVAGPSLYETAMQRAGLYVRLHQR